MEFWGNFSEVNQDMDLADNDSKATNYIWDLMIMWRNWAYIESLYTWLSMRTNFYGSVGPKVSLPCSMVHQAAFSSLNMSKNGVQMVQIAERDDGKPNEI